MTQAGSFEPEYAVGLVVATTSPGGALSNILTMIFQGDVALSVGFLI
jgi:predicted Na+-dependent transporter